MLDIKLIKQLFPSLLGASALLPLGLALNYGLNVVLARLLTVEDYGLFGYVHSLVTVLALSVSLGFANSMMRFVSSYRVQEKFDLLKGVVRGSFGLIFVISGFVAICLGFSNKLFFDNQPALLWASLLLIPFAIDNWRQSSMRGMQRTVESIIPRQILLPFGTLIIVLVFNIQNITTVLAFYLILIVILEILSVYRLKILVYKLATLSPKYDLLNWVRISVPMGLSTLARQGLMRWDIIVLGIFVGLEVTGQYTAASRTAALTVIVLRIINLVIGPHLAESYHSGQIKRFKNLIIMSTLLAAVIGAPFYIFIMYYPTLVMGIFGSGYAESALILQILTTGQFVNLISGPVGLALNMADHQRANLLIVSAVAVVNIILLVIFTPDYGVWAVAYITAASLAVLNIILAIYLYTVVLSVQENTSE